MLVATAACCLMVGCVRPVNIFAKPSAIEDLATHHVLRSPAAEAPSRGQKVFAHYCAICHGETGRGDGFNSTNLEVAPRDFSSSEFWQHATDERLRLAISNGGPAVGRSVLMPSWGKTLTDRQLNDVVAYLRTLGRRAEASLITEQQ
jgi:mono/diheme cytochrome c family protein